MPGRAGAARLGPEFASPALRGRGRVCELFGLSSRMPTRVTLSLEAFARRGGFKGDAVDGWGIAFYDGHDARLYKEPEPAQDSAWLRFIEERRLASRLLISHIRHATQGGISLANTQPFQRELGGRTHASRITAGSTVSAAPCRRLGPLPPAGRNQFRGRFLRAARAARAALAERHSRRADERLRVVARFAAAMRDLGPANFLYADGDALFAHADRRMQADGGIAPPGLWRLARRCAIDFDALATDGGYDQEMMLLASVPLTGEAWTPLDEGEVVALRDGAIVATTVVTRSDGARPVSDR